MIKRTAIVMCTGLIITTSGTSMADDGADTYKLVCSSCHESGAAGAPKLKDKEEWAHRIDHGIDEQYTSAPSGRCHFFVQDLRKDLSDEAIKAAVDYMVSQAKQPSPFQN